MGRSSWTVEAVARMKLVPARGAVGPCPDVEDTFEHINRFVPAVLLGITVLTRQQAECSDREMLGADDDALRESLDQQETSGSEATEYEEAAQAMDRKEEKRYAALYH